MNVARVTGHVHHVSDVTHETHSSRPTTDRTPPGPGLGAEVPSLKTMLARGLPRPKECVRGVRFRLVLS